MVTAAISHVPAEDDDGEPEPAEPTYEQSVMPTGMPLFIAKSEAAIEEIDKLGIPVYYLLAAAKVDNGEDPKNKYKYEEWEEPTLFKRIRLSYGHGLIKLVSSERVKLPTFKQAAFWDLPKIPLSLMELIEAFFRAVDTKISTEAVVLLTYDPLYRGSDNAPDGWGVLIPVQENSGASCKYEPESIVDQKPEQVDIVGSVHSHPHMSAYASHTDVDDQLCFDGLHITIGWMASKGGHAEFHVEYQLNNERFSFQPKDVFELEVPKDIEVPEEWMAKVTKKAPVVTTSPYASTSSSSGPKGGKDDAAGGGGKTEPSASSQYGTYFREKYNPKRPTGVPDLVLHTVVVRLLGQSEPKCPICDLPFDGNSVINRRCTVCFTYLVLPGEDIKDIIEVRKASYAGIIYAPGLEGFLSGGQCVLPVVLAEREPGGPGWRSKVVREGKASAGRPEEHGGDRRTEESSTCPACYASMPWRAKNCPDCQFQYDQEYWDWCAEQGEGPDDPRDREDTTPLGDLLLEQMAADILPEGQEWFDVYHTRACQDCEHFLSSQCPPLAQYLVSYHDKSEPLLPEPIVDVCDEFLLYLRLGQGNDEEAWRGV